MANKLGALWVGVRADSSKFNKDLDASERRLAGAANKMRQGVNKIGTAFTVMAVAATAAVTATAFAMSKAIKAASDFEETASKFSVVFKGQEKEAKSWANELVNSYRMSSEQALRFLGDMQDLLVPMGMNAEAAGEMSSQVIKLASDLGSFNNLKTEDVVRDIRAAFAGSFETMNKYGIIIRQSSVEQKALAMGLIKTKEEMTPAIKAAASYAMMIEGPSCFSASTKASAVFSRSMPMFTEATYALE